MPITSNRVKSLSLNVGIIVMSIYTEEELRTDVNTFDNALNCLLEGLEELQWDCEDNELLLSKIYEIQDDINEWQSAKKYI